MKQSLLTSLLLTLSIIFAAPPAWADAPTVGSTIPETEYFYIKNIGASTAQFTLRRGTWVYNSTEWKSDKSKQFPKLMYRRNTESGSDGTWKYAFMTQNNGNWENSSTTDLNFSVAPGDSVSFYNTSGQLSTAMSYMLNFKDNTSGASFEAGGDLMTLVNTVYVQKAPNYSFVYLFRNFTCLKKIDRLKISARSVGQGCCESMFNGCTNIQGSSMDLNSITDTVYYAAFKNTFLNCSTLTRISSLPQADTIGNNGCEAMFKSCAKITSCNGNLVATKVGSSTYISMFSGAKALLNAPNIYATKLGTSACSSMFSSCSALVTGPDTLRAKYLPNSAYYSMFFACVQLGKSPVILATSMSNATKSSEGALANMFKSGGGMVLGTIECRLTGWFPKLNTTYYYSTDYWMYYGPNSGTFICSQDLVSDGTPVYSESRIPKNNNNKWTIKYYPKVTFRVSKDRSGNDTEGGWSSTATDTVSITGDWYGDPGQELPTAWHATKDFRGWVDNEGNRIIESSAILARTTHPTTTNLILYADFANSVNFTFKVSDSGATWDGEHNNDSTWASGEAVEKVTANTPVKAGYRFVKWHTTSSGTGGSDFNPLSLPVESTTYYAIFVPLYTFDINTGTWNDETTANKSWISSEISTGLETYTPQKAGYRFVKWYTTTTGTGGDDFDPEDIPSGPTTYYAIFTPIYTFAPNGGTWNDESTTDKEFYGSFELPSIARNGHTFNGWSPALDMENLPSEPTTYTAQWTAINYTFDVATNGGTWDGSDDDNKVLTVASLPGTPQKDKYLFERWNTSADGTGTDMDASALPTTATKYYAIFIKVDYFRFIAQNAKTTISTTKYGSETAPSLSYSTDNGVTWNTFTIGTTSVELKAGDSVCFRGVNANGLNRNCKGDSFKKQPASPYWYFTSTDSVSVAGNIMTLVQGTNPTNTIPATNCFAAIMKGMPLVSAAKLQLPSSTYNGCYKYMFYNSSIRIAPELPALHVADSAYQGMFSNCQSLKIAPEIPATTVGVASMRNMFYECFALKQAPSELKAIQLYAYTYRGMFWECKQLQTSPIIRATTMPTPASSDVAAMSGMFRKCSTLVNVSVRMKTWNYVSSSLSATYYWLSYGSSTGTLTCPSALPTATRNDQTFPSGWTVNYIPELTFDVNTNGGTWDDASTTARVLDLETPMEALPTDVTAPANRTFVGWNTEADGTGDWLTVDNQPVISTTAIIRTYYAIYAMNLTFNVASVGATWDGSANENRTYTDVQFRRGEIPSPLRGEDEVRTAWVTAGGDTLKANSVLTPGTVYSPTFAEYLCITAQVDNVNVGTWYYNSQIQFNLYYSTNGMDWTKVNTTTGGRSTFVTLNTGQKVYLRGTNPNGINSSANGANYSSGTFVKFTVSNNATLSGNLMYLIHPTTPPTTIPNTHCFAKLFKNNTEASSQYCKITDASHLKLPATTLTASCYEGLFHDCNVLVNGPKLTATNLAADCYKWLFYGCSALRRVEVTFSDWNDDGSGNPAYTFQWMYGTTTNAEHNARFIGPAVLFEHVRNNGHIQTNWKGMDFELLDDQDDAYYTALKDMDGMALQQVTFKGTFPAKRWITFNVPFDFFIPEDHPFANHVYQFLGADGNATEGFDIHFQSGVYELQAGMPYLYYGDETLTDFVFAADGENNLILTIDADALEEESVWPTEPEINTSGAEYRSTVKMTPLPGGDKHYIYLSRNSLYYPHALGNTLYAFSGYFYVPSTGSIAPRVRMMVNGVETNVQVEGLGAEEQAAQAGTKKYILDGTLVIERNGIRYDAHGHKLN